MHLLIAAHDYYPDPGSGGTGRYVAETARRLVRRGHDVSVLTRRRGGVPEREVRDGVDVYRYDVAVAGRTAPGILRRLPGATATVARHLAAMEGVDVASFQGPVTAALVDRLLDGAVPRVATFHSPWPVEYRIRTRGSEGRSGRRRRANVALRRHIEGRTLDGTDAVVTLSAFMRDELRRLYDPAADVTVVPGGVDTTRYVPAGRTLDGVDGDPAFLTVRRLSRRMGHETLLRAFSTVLEDRPGARLYVAGDGPLRDRLEAAARTLGVGDATTFLGYVPDDDLPALYRAADVFVLPTAELEGFGLATLEALASGLPVVATPVGGTVELLSDLEALTTVGAPMLVPSVDAAALATGMRSWARLPADEATAVAQTCRRYADARFRWDRTVTGLEAVYGDLLRASTGDRTPPRSASWSPTGSG